MSFLKDLDCFRSIELPFRNPNGNGMGNVIRSKYLPHLEALYSRKNTAAPPICYDNEKTTIKKSFYYHSLPRLLQTYIHQQGTGHGESFFGQSPIVRSSIQVTTGASEGQITIQYKNIEREKLQYSCKLYVQRHLYEQELFIQILDQLIISMEEAFSLKLYNKVVENLTALENSAEFPNALIPHANIADLLLFLWYSSPCPVVAVIPRPYYPLIHLLKSPDGARLSYPELMQIPIIPMGTDVNAPSFVLSRDAMGIFYYDDVNVYADQIESSAGVGYALNAFLYYYLAILDSSHITGVANTQEALKRIAA
jgi:hypothetical protein